MCSVWSVNVSLNQDFIIIIHYNEFLYRYLPENVSATKFSGHARVLGVRLQCCHPQKQLHK